MNRPRPGVKAPRSGGSAAAGAAVPGGRIGRSMAGRPAKDTLRLGGALAAALFGGALSFVLLLRHHGLDAGALGAAVCDPSNSGCEAVAASDWSAAFGVPLAAVGLAFFASLALLLGFSLAVGAPLRSRPGRLALRLVALALLVDLFLFGVQAFSIGAYCSLCLWTYAANAAAFAGLLPAGFRDRSPLPAAASVRPLWDRAAPAFWVVASVVAAAVLFFDRGLGVRAESSGPDLSLLGVRSARSAAPEEAPVKAAGLLPASTAPVSPPQWRVPPFQQQPVREIPLDGVPFRGAAGAPVEIVTFSDFLCPSCRRFALAFDQYAEGPTGPHVALYYRSYPLDNDCAAHLPRALHPGACEVARGAACAARQDRFWEYHDRVYLAPPVEPTADDVVRIAEVAGLDADEFRVCLDSPEAEAAVAADIAEAMRLGVTGTPTIFINGRRVPSLDQFADAVLWELGEAGIEVPRDGNSDGDSPAGDSGADSAPR